MKALFRILPFIVLCLCPISVKAGEVGVFRHFVWGVSEEDVRKFETATFYKQEGDSLIFLEKPDDFRRLITYDFKDGKLWRAKYEYVDLHYPNPQDVIDLYGKEEAKLEITFGPPTEEALLWKDKKYLRFPQFWGRSLLSGDLKFRARWQTPDTDIELQTYHGKDFYQTFYTMQKREAGAAGTPVDIFDSPIKSR